MSWLKRFVSDKRIIERHRNPVGIILRIPTYLFLFYALWSNKILLVVIALLIEIALWFLVPPVMRTYPFLESVIQAELRWLRARNNQRKITSILFLLTGVILLTAGLWIHSYITIAFGFASLIIFNLLMNQIANDHNQ